MDPAPSSSFAQSRPLFGGRDRPLAQGGASRPAWPFRVRSFKPLATERAGSAPERPRETS